MNISARLFLVLVICCMCGTLGAEERMFTVGAVLPLTGPASEYGISIVNALEMARRDRPGLFENVQILFEDARYDAAAAVASFHKLTQIDRVDIVFTWGISFCQALAPLAQERRVPLIAECIDPDLGRNRSFVLRPMNHADQYTSLTLDYLASNGLMKLGVILSDTNYLEMMLTSLERSLKPRQTVAVVDRVAATGMDFRSSISRLRTGEYDAVGVFLSVGQVGQFFRQAKQQHLDIPAFGTNVFESSSETAAAGGAMEGAVYAFNHVSPDFILRYGEYYGGGSQLGFAAVSYEVVTVLAEIVAGNNPVPHGEDLIRAFASVGSRTSGVTGPYSVGTLEGGSVFLDFPLTMKQIVSGRIEPVRP